MTIRLVVDGDALDVDDEDGPSLLEVLRERLAKTSVKDGCSPQGQCGCCTVLVDGAPRVACVTPVRRLDGATITTLEGLDDARRDSLVRAFVATGAAQCGFCTPGILLRLAALDLGAGPARVEAALLAHLCRCTGWQTILEAAELAAEGGPVEPVSRDWEAARRRATLEGHGPQAVGPEVVRGRGGFADDAAPPGALVAIPDDAGGWAVAETVAEARRAAGRVQGRRSGGALHYPLEVPEGEWALTLQTTWVEPAYLEPDASWCLPGAEPASPLGNGGAFGGKLTSPLPAVARRLADEHGRAVRALWTREDVVRFGPKRPPIAAGLRSDGTGVLRVVRTAGVAEALRGYRDRLVVEEIDVPGPPTSADLRAAGWAEAAVLLAAADALRDGRGRQPLVDDGARATAGVVSPTGASAEATVVVDADGAPVRATVSLACGPVLDAVVLRSFVIGAVHMALGWVSAEGVAVDDQGHPQDLTIRSYGILRARDMPTVDVELREGPGPPVNGSDAVFAAAAAACWLAQGLPGRWPTRRATGR